MQIRSDSSSINLDDSSDHSEKYSSRSESLASSSVDPPNQFRKKPSGMDIGNVSAIEEKAYEEEVMRTDS